MAGAAALAGRPAASLEADAAGGSPAAESTVPRAPGFARRLARGRAMGYTV